MMSQPRVFVTRIIPEAGLALLRPHCQLDVWNENRAPEPEILVQRAKGVEGILTMLTDRIDGAFLDAVGPQLKVVSQCAVGYDNIDVTAAFQRGIPVGNTPGVLTEATADLAFALLMAAARRLNEGIAYVQNGEWKNWDPQVLLGQEITGATLGIVGFGRIGQAAAKRARGFDMRVLAYSPSLTDADAKTHQVEHAELDTLLRESDFVSLHMPLNAQTRHLINQAALAKMKPSAILINTARGGVIDQQALVEALENRVIAGAALDVTDPEPIPYDHPLLKLPNVIIVPHVGSATVKTREKMAMIAAKNLLAGLKGEPLLHQVQPK